MCYSPRNPHKPCAKFLASLREPARGSLSGSLLPLDNLKRHRSRSQLVGACPGTFLGFMLKAAYSDTLKHPACPGH